MLGKYCRDLGNYLFRGLTPLLARLGIQTWMINLCAVVCAIGSGYFFFANKIALALSFLFAEQIFDYMDGGIRRARVSLRMKPFRYRLLCHVLADKLSELVIFSGMIAGSLVRIDLGLFTVFSGLILTIFGRWIQYKGLFDLKNSLVDRTDRFAVLLILCPLRHFQLALIIISIVNIVGIVQRLISLTAHK